MATAPRAFTDKDIQDYLKATYNLNPGGQSFIDDKLATELYKDAGFYNIKEDQLDRAMGWRAGTSADWIRRAGLEPLTKQTTSTTALTDSQIAEIMARSGNTSNTNTAATTNTTNTTNTATTTPPPAVNPNTLFDPNAEPAWLKAYTESLKSLAPDPNAEPAWLKAWTEANTKAPFEITSDMERQISAESRIPRILTGATARAAGDNAMGQANSRGLLNSSMAVEAANNAMIANAAEIASGDANRYGSLLSTGLNNDAALSRLIASGQLNAQMENMRSNNDFNNMLFKSGADMLTSNMNWNRELARNQMNNAREDAVYARNRGDILTDRADIRANEDRIYGRNRADEIADREAGWARQDSVTGAARDEALQTAYTGAVAQVESQLSTRISAIQASDLPANVKQAQIQFEIGWAQTRVTMVNAMFSNMPGWKAEWSQLELEIPTGG